jgi:FkbM family methyltransferase
MNRLIHLLIGKNGGKNTIIKMFEEYNIFDVKFLFKTHDCSELTSDLIKKYKCNIDIETVYAYKNLLHNGDYFLDVGANIGWNTIFASKNVGDNGKVFSFEPNFKNFELLKNNVEQNLLQNVSLIQKALSDTNGELKLFLSNNNFGNHILSPNFYNPDVHNDSENVFVVTLDDFLNDNQIDKSKISLIKIDVEGTEPKVLIGGNKFFTEFAPNIILEFSPFLIKQCGSSMFDVLSFIDKFGYVPFLIKDIDINNPKYDLYEISIIEIMELAKRLFETCSYKDLLLIHNTKLKHYGK